MKKRLLCLIVILIFIFSFYLAEATSFKNNLKHYVAKQRNKIPNRYTAPTDTQISIFREAIDSMLNEEFASAASLAGAIDYSLKSLTHSNGSTYYILEPSDPKLRPWGTYIFYLEDDNENVLVEAPHPIEEKNTSSIGINAFIDSKARTFLMSGSRKGAGDVTVIPESVFQAVHEEAAGETQTVVLQIHGFNRRKLPQAILTSGTPVAISAMDLLVDELIQNDFEIGIFDGTQFADFGATQNEQAKFTNNIGGSFIGIFLNQAVHHSKSKSALIVDAIKEYALTETTSSETTS